MKKRKNPDKTAEHAKQNPVAKFAHRFNQAQIFVAKTHYRRQPKHRKQEASLIPLCRLIKEFFYFRRCLTEAVDIYAY